MTNSLIQSLSQADQSSGEQGSEVDYVKWATEKFHKEDGSLDLDALIRGKYESDVKFIPRILDEQKELRKDLETRETLQDFMNKWESSRVSQNAGTQAPVITPANGSANSPSISSITEQDIARLVDERVTNRQKEAQARANVQEATNALVSRWGGNYVEKLNTRAKQLGVSVGFLSQVAESSPKAFTELVLGNTPAAPPVAPNSHVPPRNQRVSQPVVNTGHKTKAEWEKLRKSNAREYWKVENQQKMIADSEALGEDFYN